MKLKAIVAYGEDRVIGKDNDLIWHLPNDLKHFKKHTSGKPIIMGRKTFESLGRPLPNRRNIVITRNANWAADGVEVVHSLDQAIQSVQDVPEAFIVGGAQIYELAMPLVKVFELTVVHATLPGDAYFPAWDSSEFELASEQRHEADENHAYPFTFQTWVRK